jgi:hypothetical protein
MIFLCMASVFVTLNALADTVTLKSGQEIEGNIVERTDESVRMESFGVEVTYFMDEIDKINGESVAASVQETADVPDVTEEGTGALIEPEESGSADISKQTEEAPASLTAEPDPRPDQRKDMLLAAGVSLSFIILVVLLYAYSALCLQVIAKKTNQEPAWLAWVPVANLFLMCKIGSLNYLWLLGILLSFLPLVGVFFGLALFGYLWYRIALARNKPGWLGILGCLPFVNFVVMGYLAFSE